MQIIQSKNVKNCLFFREQVLAEQKQAQKRENPSNFGIGCERACICMVPGQLPCPGVVRLPDHMRGKFKYNAE